MSYKIIVTVLF